jgi:outer membrane protein OmpA-like peptidoglycan-associated protein
MKAPLILTALVVCASLTHAQSVGDVVKQQAGEGVKQGATVATEQTANSVTNKLVNKLFSKKTKKVDSSKLAAGNAGVGVAAGQGGPTGGSATGSSATGSGAGGSSATGSSAGDWNTYSKFDFVPGEKILAVEDFNQDAVGDFPDKWNTNSTGEVRTISGKDGKWLSLTKRGFFLPEFITELPENFTLQFDLVCSPNFKRGAGNFAVDFENLPNPGKDFTHLGHGVSRNGPIIYFQANASYNHGETSFSIFQNDEQIMNNQIDQDEWVGPVAGKNVCKISIWRQRQRIRVYMNEQKIWDLPRAFQSDKKYNSLLFSLTDDVNPGDLVLFGNVRLAVGAPDTRNKLVTEGKFSTTGILFDVNSATVKPESYGTLKDIADVLKDDANLKVTIVGHTDGDGDAAQNLTLSHKRADAVKDALVKQFGIDASRIQTDGKGSTQPVSPNNTATGKAQNRRVEFIKTAG